MDGSEDILGQEGEEVDRSRHNRMIREQYRKLLADTQSEEETAAPQLKEKLNEANELFAHVMDDMPREATLDARVLHQLSIAGMRKAETLQTNMVSFEPLDFAEKMATFMSTSGEREAYNVSANDWELFGRNVHALYKRSPAFHLMFGSFTRTPPERKVRETRAKFDKDSGEAKKTAPQNVKEMGKNAEEVTTEEVERVLQVMRTIHIRNLRKVIGYFDFVCHPTSFSQTIQNIFHASFLVNDGYARLYLDENGLPVIEPLDVHDSDDNRTNVVATENGIVISITQDEWQDIVRVFKITKPAIQSTSASK